MMQIRTNAGAMSQTRRRACTGLVSLSMLTMWFTPVGRACSASAQEPPAAQPEQTTQENQISQQPTGEEEIRKAMQAASKGRVAIRVTQGTIGADPVGEANLKLLLFHKGSLVEEHEAATDDHGVAIVEDIMIAMQVDPLVQVEYAGVTYQAWGEQPLGPQNPEGTITVPVYMVTEVQPDWFIPMMHVFVTPTAQGPEFKETVIVENRSDKTWLGDTSAPPPPGPSGQGDAQDMATGVPTVRFIIPADAHDIRLRGGFHGWCCTSREGSELVVRMPMMPGQHRFVFSYRLPATVGKLDLMVGANATIGQAVVFAPDDASTIVPAAMDDLGPQKMGDMALRAYSATGVERGKAFGISMSNIVATGAATGPASGNAPAPGTQGTVSAARTYVLIGAGALVLFAVFGLIFKRSD